MRLMHNVGEHHLLEVFSISNLLQEKIQVKLQSGKGGAFFIIPDDRKFMIKSIAHKEFEIFKLLLADYYNFFLMNPTSFITPIYGLYSLKVTKYNAVEPLYFILMRNVLDFHKSKLPRDSKILTFDLKGSTAGRKTLNDPRILLQASIPEYIYSKTLKDEDFLLSFGRFDITRIQSDKIVEQLRIDSNFFARHKLIDYSLLVFIIFIPFHKVTNYMRGLGEPGNKEKDISEEWSEEEEEESKGEVDVFEIAKGVGKENELYIDEVTHQKHGEYIVMEERLEQNRTLYHINNQKDIREIRSMGDHHKIRPSSPMLFTKAVKYIPGDENIIPELDVESEGEERKLVEHHDNHDDVDNNKYPDASLELGGEFGEKHRYTNKDISKPRFTPHFHAEGENINDNPLGGLSKSEKVGGKNYYPNESFEIVDRNLYRQTVVNFPTTKKTLQIKKYSLFGPKEERGDRRSTVMSSNSQRIMSKDNTNTIIKSGADSSFMDMHDIIKVYIYIYIPIYIG